MFDWIINIFKICYKNDNDTKQNFIYFNEEEQYLIDNDTKKKSIYFNEDKNEHYLIDNNSCNITKI
jgi:hypothetical protein